MATFRVHNKNVKRGNMFQHRTMLAHVEFSGNGVRIFDLGSPFSASEKDNDGSYLSELTNPPIASFKEADVMTICNAIIDHALRNGYTDVSVTKADVSTRGVNMHQCEDMDVIGNLL